MIQAKIDGLLNVNINSLAKSSLNFVLGKISTIQANVTLLFSQSVTLKLVQAAIDSRAGSNSTANLYVIESKYCIYFILFPQ